LLQNSAIATSNLMKNSQIVSYSCLSSCFSSVYAIFHSTNKQKLTSEILILVDFIVLCQAPMNVSMDSMIGYLLSILTDLLCSSETQISL
jgi:hypothetical protein